MCPDPSFELVRIDQEAGYQDQVEPTRVEECRLAFSLEDQDLGSVDIVPELY